MRTHDAHARALARCAVRSSFSTLSHKPRRLVAGAGTVATTSLASLPSARYTHSKPKVSAFPSPLPSSAIHKPPPPCNSPCARAPHWHSPAQALASASSRRLRTPMDAHPHQRCRTCRGLAFTTIALHEPKAVPFLAMGMSMHTNQPPRYPSYLAFAEHGDVAVLLSATNATHPASTTSTNPQDFALP